ncbi:hypothetical protein GCM10011504_47770 [Siccirubricoccus deserti]|uniref:Helix-turn-helix domain-containing protein n=1 Tax=Siccirubricoccus deserti TaxID=2013562 RepID=A0A9X0UJP4_9PROT|nr:helix-turn-helix domain-containing protein [Siccirubricoccus deserti]MBC4018310.1 helix-turn-helix domain-containing protein [Siccirubricoccus deserti]GGC64007.1 hypothetical protein GCM10011504_47770 [Siccirubricoccus deserti]
MTNLDHINRQPPAVTAALAYTVADLQRVARIGKSKTYELLAAGDLRAVKAGGRTLILADSLRDYLARLPVVQSKKVA